MQVEQLAAALKNRMTSVAGRLERLIHDREDAFLALGRTLQDAAEQVAAITQQSRALTLLTTGEALGHIMEELGEELDKLNDLCGQGGGESELAELGHTRELLQQLFRSIREYAKVVRTLQMLGISTRIESARLGADGKGFSTLADDVEKLAIKIVEYSESILRQGTQLDTLVSSAEADTHSMAGLQQQCSYSAFAGLRQHVTELEGASKDSAEASRRAEAHLGEVGMRMAGVISSLQMHDIIRQQVEHVCESLAEAQQALDTAHACLARGDEPAAWQELAFVAEICSLQDAQIHAANTSFSQSVQALRTDLHAIAGHVHGVAMDSGSLSMSEQSGAPSVLATMEDSVRDMATSMLELAAKGESMGHLMESVADTVSQMTAFLEDIEDVGDEIELIALNASIRAAHTGDKGKALGVLATSIQRLSQDAGEQTAALSELLRSIDGTASGLRNMAMAHLDTTHVQTAQAELETLTHALRALNTEASGLFADIHNVCTRVEGSLTHAVAGCDFDRHVDSGLSQAATAVAAMVQDIRKDLPPAHAHVPAHRLRATHARYTMAQERVLHGKVTGHGHNDDGMDDNVELF